RSRHRRCVPDLAGGGERVRGVEDRAPGNEDVDAGFGGGPRGLDVDPAVDLDLDVQTARVDLRARGAHLVEHLRGERRSAPARVHAHHQQQVDLVEERQHLVHGGGRVEHEPDADVELAQPLEERSRITELDVHDAAVRARFGEVVEQHTGVVDHEVAVE